MELGNWSTVKTKLLELDKEIFKGIDKTKLNDYEKRKLIYNYLCNNLQYDFQYLNIIIAISQKKIVRERNPYKEIESVLFDKKGVCNGIAQVYRLLLEENGIYSLCVICDNNMEVPHQLNLVYDKEHNTYSFDDITSVIVGIDKIDKLFDYDKEYAQTIGQGTKKLVENEEWTFLPAYYLDFLVGRESNFYKQFGIDDDKTFVLPKNIKQIKNKENIK